MNESAPSNPPAPDASPIDLADLVSLLVSLDGPSRVVDCVVEAMLGGYRPLGTVSPDVVIKGRWLAKQALPFTESEQAVSVLAHRRGLTVRIDRVGAGFRAEATEPVKGATGTAVARTAGCAGVAAIARLVSSEAGR